jgi:hypothetical protein
MPAITCTCTGTSVTRRSSRLLRRSRDVIIGMKSGWASTLPISRMYRNSLLKSMLRPNRVLRIEEPRIVICIFEINLISYCSSFTSHSFGVRKIVLDFILYSYFIFLQYFNYSCIFVMNPHTIAYIFRFLLSCCYLSIRINRTIISLTVMTKGGVQVYLQLIFVEKLIVSGRVTASTGALHTAKILRPSCPTGIFL